jgi:ribosome-binding protein aMBF1 (putative translation factor)
MRKPHIEADTVELYLKGPAAKRKEALAALQSLGFVDISEGVPWRTAFSEITEENLPGTVLAGARAKENLSQQELSRLTGIPQRHISEMENGKRPIGKEMAKRLAKALNISYKVFL